VPEAGFLDRQSKVPTTINSKTEIPDITAMIIYNVFVDILRPSVKFESLKALVNQEVNNRCAKYYGLGKHTIISIISVWIG